MAGTERISARAILIDDQDRLVLIRRTRPGRAPYWTSVQRYFLARLLSLDSSARHGPEFADPSRGSYDVERVDLRSGALRTLDLMPPELKEFILANREALLDTARTLG